jgi:PilZ domain-containing protein
MERRRAKRVAMTPPANPVSVVGARIVDVSPFGMMIESPVAISPDAVIPFRIVVAGRTSDVSCRVATCRPAAGDDQRHFGVGLEFLDLAEESRNHLREVLQHPTA